MKTVGDVSFMWPGPAYPPPHWPGGYPGLPGYPLGGYPVPTPSIPTVYPKGGFYPPGTIPGVQPPPSPCPPGYKMVWPRFDPHTPIRTDSPGMVPFPGSGGPVCVPIGVAPNQHVGAGVPGMMYPGNPFLVQAWEHGVVRTNLSLPSDHDQQAYDMAKYLLDTWPWKLTPNWTSGGVVRVTGPMPQVYRLVPSVLHGLLGQWVIASGRWCHQGGPWTAGLPTCSYEVFQPSYPTYHPRTWAGPVRG